jgi:hypothetical protein
MVDGSVIAVHAIICATGFDTSYIPAFPVVGFENDLRELWKNEPTSYLSVAAAGIPNYFSEYYSTFWCPQVYHMWLIVVTNLVMSGPNFPLANGGLFPCLENNIKYAFQVAKKLCYEGIKCLAPKQAAVDDYQEYKDCLMAELVWTGSCASW